MSNHPLKKRTKINLKINNMKTIVIFLSVFLFIELCGIYVMGGFWNQTIESKFNSTALGIILASLVTSITWYESKN